LQKKIDDAGLNGFVASLHPGVVRTELSRYMKPFIHVLMKMLYPIYWLMTKSSQQGAQTTLYLVYEEKDQLKKGEYYADCKVEWSTEISKNMQAAERLWKIS
jgi:retinol dehydrogenase-12